MRMTLKALMKDLGVSYILSPYETRFWSHTDAEKALTCSAEVRMWPDELDAEIQLIHEIPSPGETGLEQMLWLRAVPRKDDNFAITHLRIKKSDYVNRMSGWETKGCALFRACTQALELGEIPDFDELIARTMTDEGAGVSGSRGGGKAPKAKMDQILNLTKGRGF